ncbi:MAG: S9 family peptidase, partial [Limisphaerales bacterium]
MFSAQDPAPRNRVIARCLSLGRLLLLATGVAASSSASGSGDSASPSTPAFAYPPARRGNVVEDYQGVKVADPYRWLENLDSPETRAWVTAEARLTESYLEKIPARETIKQRLRSLLNFEKYGMPFHKGAHYFYTLNRGLQQQSVLYTTIGLSGSPIVALDPNTLSTNGSLAVVGYVASRDGAKLAYGISPGGSDWTEWHIRDVATGQDLPDVLRWTKYYQPIFAPDGKGLYYSGFPAPPPGEELRARDLGDTVCFHALGTPQSSDRKLYERTDHPDWQFEPHLTQDGRWLVLVAGEGEVGDKGLMKVYALDVGSAHPAVVPLAEGFEAAYLYAGAAHGRLYFQTTLDAPRGRVIAIDPTTPERSRWKEIVPQGADAMAVADRSVTLIADQLIVRTLHEAHSQVTLYGLDGHRRREVKLPGHGEASGFGGESNPTWRIRSSVQL